MLYLYTLRQNYSTTATRIAGSSWWASWKAAVSALEKCCTVLAVAIAAQLSRDTSGRQSRYPSAQEASFTDQIRNASLLQGKGRKKYGNVLCIRFNIKAT